MATYPVFAVGEVLTADDMNAVGWWLIKTETVGTSVASVTITNAFPSDYKTFMVIYSDGVASASASIEMRLGPSSVSNYNTSYYTGLIYVVYGTPGVQEATFQDQSRWIWMSRADQSQCNLSVIINNPNVAKKTTITNGNYNLDTLTFGITNGVHNQNRAYTDLSIFPSTGTLTGGKISVYGWKQ